MEEVVRIYGWIGDVIWKVHWYFPIKFLFISQLLRYPKAKHFREGTFTTMRLHAVWDTTWPHTNAHICGCHVPGVKATGTILLPLNCAISLVKLFVLVYHIINLINQALLQKFIHTLILDLFQLWFEMNKLFQLYTVELQTAKLESEIPSK